MEILRKVKFFKNVEGNIEWNILDINVWKVYDFKFFWLKLY